MKLKVMGVICTGCGDTAYKLSGMRQVLPDLWQGYSYYCRCYDCGLDFNVMFDDEGKLKTVLMGHINEFFMASAGRRDPIFSLQDIPF